MSQVCFNLTVQGIRDSLPIHTGLLRVFLAPSLLCFEHSFEKWLVREIHIWLWFKDQQVGAVSSGLGLTLWFRDRAKPPFTQPGKDPVTTACSQPPQLQVDLPPLHPMLHVVQEPQPSNPSESLEGNTLIDFETLTVKRLIKT